MLTRAKPQEIITGYYFAGEEELKERGVEVDVYGIEIQGNEIGYVKVNEA